MIEKRTVAVATCDGCGRDEYADEDGYFADGYSLTIVQHATRTQHEAFACKETHISKAARAVLEKWQFEWDNGVGRYGPGGDRQANQWHDKGGTLPSATSVVAGPTAAPEPVTVATDVPPEDGSTP